MYNKRTRAQDSNMSYVYMLCFCLKIWICYVVLEERVLSVYNLNVQHYIPFVRDLEESSDH